MTTMTKKVVALAAVTTLSFGLLTGCGSTANAGSSNSEKKEEATAGTENKELETITVGASVTPHAEILNAVKDDLAAKGYDLKVVEYNDYVQPNTALENKELDANYFQHKPYLDDFNKENGTHIVSAAGIHFEPLGIYAGKTDSLDKLEDGAEVAVPNDTTNEARALLLLQQEGLIKLKDGVGLEATVVDIEENPHKLKISELEAAQIARAVQDVDIAVINGNYALEAQLPAAIALESAESEAAKTYANIIAVREGEENSEKTKALVEAVQSQKVKDFIKSKYNDSVVPVF